MIDLSQSHSLFNLLLLYLRENIKKLDHLEIFILTPDDKQAVRLMNYFSSNANYFTAKNHNYFINYNLNFNCFYLDDIETIDNNQLLLTRPVLNEEVSLLEIIIYQVWSQLSPLDTLIKFIFLFPCEINNSCRGLFGITPLIVTIVHGSLDEVYQLLVLGADCKIASWNGMTPIEWAIKYDRQNIFQLLFIHQYSINSSFDLNFLYNNDSNNLKLITNDINYDLILQLLSRIIKQINQFNFNNKQLPESILIILPSYDHISTLRKRIIDSLSRSEFHCRIFCLYPNLPNSELDASIPSTSNNQIAIILSTINLESLIFDNIHFIINTGFNLNKMSSIFCSTNLYRVIPNSIKTNQIKDLFLEEKMPIIIYNLFRKDNLLNMNNNNIDLNRLTSDSMYHCIMVAKCLDFNNEKIDNLFQKMIIQPNPMIVSKTLSYLTVNIHFYYYYIHRVFFEAKIIIGIYFIIRI